MKPGSTGGAHLDDATIARLHDRAVSDAERAELEHHIARCAVCRATIDRFAEQSLMVRRALEATDEPFAPIVRRASSRLSTRQTPARSTTRVLQRAAMVLFMLGAGLMATKPTRAWMIGRWNDLRAVLRGAPSQAPAPVASDSVPSVIPIPSNVATLTFASSSDSLLIRVVARQREGEVTIARMDRPDILIEIDGGGDELVGVVPNELTIENTTGSVASYRISIPQGLRVVLVRIGDETPRRIDWRNRSVFTMQLAPR